MVLERFMDKYIPSIENELKGCLPPETTYPERLHEAMRYSTIGAGKRLRALLAIAAAEMVAQDKFPLIESATYRFAAAAEMLHAYTLIHDDLPCMDDDDFRRGKPSNHKVFGEGLAVLAGDALLTETFAVMMQLADMGIPAATVIALTKELAMAAGSRGVIGGQAVDLASEGQTIDHEILEYIHTHKTGALFKAVLRGGALLAGASSHEIEAVTEYAECFGLCFQITDDILDVVGDESKLGKRVGSDSGSDKATYVSLYGLERARELAEETMEKAKAAIDAFAPTNRVLCELAEYVVGRDH
ncbi:MAG: polyprenyl synthetase family protein [Firmicutes bacterium]|nr:polyprenyl synthetase family protein [Bacillota bacterium]